MPQNLDMRSIERGTNFSHVSTYYHSPRGVKERISKLTSLRFFQFRLRIQSLRHITRCRTRSRTNDRIRQRRKTSRGIGSLSWSSLPRMSSPIKIRITRHFRKTKSLTMHTKKQNMIRWGLYRETYVVLVSPEETELHLGTYFFYFLHQSFRLLFPQIRELTFSFLFFSFSRTLRRLSSSVHSM